MQVEPGGVVEAEAPGGDAVYGRLRRLIIEGHYAPGTRLVEDRLARDLGVSRTPVRQALARVAVEGLVQLFPNRGAVVRTFTHADLVDAYDLRAVMEGYAAYRAAGRISPGQLADLEAAAAALEGSLQQHFPTRQAEVHFLVEHNQRFHNTIIAASGNPLGDPNMAQSVRRGAVPMHPGDMLMTFSATSRSA